MNAYVRPKDCRSPKRRRIPDGKSVFHFSIIVFKSKMLDIHILWEGPFSRDEALKLTSSSDYGLYQFYGDHLVYGRDVLLYLGKAETQTFGRRISQHNWEMWTASPATIYVGKICSAAPLELDEWIKQINLSERIILQSHNPSFNSANLNKIGHNGEDTRVLNWGKRKQLLPEVSVSRWEGSFAIGNKLREIYKPQGI
jgi:hypothetical protein